MGKTDGGRFFEDFSLGQVVEHPTPRTLTEGDRALYAALYPSRFPITSSQEFAASCGLSGHPLDELLAFHVAFGKTVGDISLNAVANLGYAECRFHRAVRPGDTLRATSEVIGLKENSSGRTGVVHVRSRARDQHQRLVAEWVRWVMVRKRDVRAAAPAPVLPELAAFVAPEDLVVPDGLDLRGYDFAAAGEPHRWGDYEVGERIDHVDGVTLTDPEHMLATRLWQNTAKVHFDVTAREDGRRLIYGGHIISLARALSCNGLMNAALVLAINAGSHVAPAFAGDTVHAWSEVLDTADLAAPGAGALRVRLVATRGRDESMTLRGPDGSYADGVLLDLDLWVAVPR